MTVSSVLKTLSVATVAMTATISMVAPAEALSLKGSLSITGTAIFGKPNQASPLQDTLSFRSNRVEDDASGDFTSLGGLNVNSISTLNLNRTFGPVSFSSGVTTTFYQFEASSNPFINFGNRDLFGTGVQSLSFILNPGTAQRNYFSSNSFNVINLSEVTGTFIYGGSTIGKGSLSASRSGSSNSYEITLRAEPIPEPFTILGSLSALGAGTLMKKQHDKRQNKVKSDA
jgi:hypothetical protein